MSEKCQEWKVQVTTSMIYNDKISDAAFRTLLTIQTFIRNNDTAWPSIETLAEKRGKTTRALKRHIRELKDLGLVEVVIRKTTSAIFSIPADDDKDVTSENQSDTLKDKNVPPVTKMSSQDDKNVIPEGQKCPLPTIYEEEQKEEDKEKKASSSSSSQTVKYLKEISDTCHNIGKPLSLIIEGGLANTLGEVSLERFEELTPYVIKRLRELRPTADSWWQDGSILGSLRRAYMGTRQDPTPWAMRWRDEVLTKKERTEEKRQQRERQEDREGDFLRQCREWEKDSELPKGVDLPSWEQVEEEAKRKARQKELARESHG